MSVIFNYLSLTICRVYILNGIPNYIRYEQYFCKCDSVSTATISKMATVIYGNFQEQRSIVIDICYYAELSSRKVLGM